MGHAVRCSALGIALRDRGHDVCFLLSPESLSGRAYLSSLDFDVALLHDVRFDNEDVDALIVDWYGASSADIAQWSAQTRVCVIDDLADRDLRTATWIVNQNFGAEEFVYSGVVGERLLLGPGFAIVRPYFADVRSIARRTFTDAGRKVLLTLGGGDVREPLLRVLDELGKVHSTLDIVVTGAQADAAIDSHHRVRFQPHIEDIASTMAWADLSICAGGTTVFELCCLGTPMIVTAIAGNQVPGSRALARLGVALGVFDLRESLKGLGERVERFVHDSRAREACSLRASTLVDGLGAQRVARVLELG